MSGNLEGSPESLAAALATHNDASSPSAGMQVCGFFSAFDWKAYCVWFVPSARGSTCCPSEGRYTFNSPSRPTRGDQAVLPAPQGPPAPPFPILLLIVIACRCAHSNHKVSQPACLPMDF
jgi:hypothetical protein